MPDPILTTPVVPPRVAVWFWRRVDFTDTCWLWQGSTNSGGYGRMYVGNRKRGPVREVLAHRWSLYLATGKWAQQFVLHTCDNPLCVNPRHLYEGTQADNVRDRVARDRNAAQDGENNGFAKLTWESVRAMRSDYATGLFTLVDLGLKYNVHFANVHYVVKHKTWVEKI